MVAPQLRVHGIEWPCGVDAVMPILVGGHTNAPTMMIAERQQAAASRASTATAADL